MDLADFDVDDSVLTDRGVECRVTNIDVVRSCFTVETPQGLLLQFYDTDVEDLPAPVDGGREALEQWFRCKALIVPRLRHETDTTRCSAGGCICPYCYVVTTSSHRPDDFADITSTKHFTDSELCKCYPEFGPACPCLPRPLPTQRHSA